MQPGLPFLTADPEPPERETQFVRVRRARKYILRVRPDGTVRVTIPRGGSRREAEAFLARHERWIAEERLRVSSRHAAVCWRAGDTIPLGGVPTPILVQQHGRSTFVVVGEQRVRIVSGVTNLRPAAEKALRQLAVRQVVPRLQALAAEHGLSVGRVTVRNQRSRWGSCSTRGVIALNFRLIQMPSWVCDYVLVHELMHLRQQNHSAKYWRLVEAAYPRFREAERWLRVEGPALF